MNTAYSMFVAICRIDARGDSLSCYAKASEPARPLNDAHLAGVVLLEAVDGIRKAATIDALALRQNSAREIKNRSITIGRLIRGADFYRRWGHRSPSQR